MKTLFNLTQTFLFKTSILSLTLLLIFSFESIAYKNINIQIYKKLNLADSLHQELKIKTDPEFKVEIAVELNEYLVYDQNDQLVFSGSEYIWQNNTSYELKSIKRQAEFLFKSDNTHIYRLFSTSQKKFITAKGIVRKKVRKFKNLRRTIKSSQGKP